MLISLELADIRNDVASELKRMLISGELQILGATSADEYREYIEMDTSLEFIFQSIQVKELSVEQTTQILRGLRDSYEAHHRVSITDDALVAAAELTHRYISDRFLPDKAIDLIDEAGALLRIRRMTPPPSLTLIDEEIATVRMEKEAAIDAQDFERARPLRDREGKLQDARGEKEKAWKNGELDEITEVDANIIVEALAGKLDLPVSHILWENHDEPAPSDATSPVSGSHANPYVLLGDRPVENLLDDFMSVKLTAQTIASVLSDSRSSSPFVMALDGGWGVGKSTLLNQIANHLPKTKDIRIIRFNAWTSRGENALESLIKSVLIELDSNSLRKLSNKLARKKRTVGVIRLFIRILVHFLGAGKLLDEIWNRAQLDAKGRNELRATIVEIITEWNAKGSNGTGGRALIVLIDDLDRCSEKVIIQVCEAVKLYLDAPGMIFVMACDIRVLKNGVATLDHVSEAAIYLEKIVQVVHRIHPPNDTRLRELIDGYAKRSGISELIDDNVREILLSRTERNPRRIKRILNSFILASRLDPSWSAPKLGNDQLVRVVILQHLYPTFYEALVQEQASADPIGDFLDFTSVKERVSNPPIRSNAWWTTTSTFLLRHGISPPPRSTTATEKLLVIIKSLEEDLPKDWSELSKNRAFVLLLRGFGDREARLAVRSHLLSDPLPTDMFTEMST